MKIFWTLAARKDLKTIETYIKQENPAAAINVVSKIVNKIKTLLDNPSLGKHGRFIGTRELVITNLPYIVPYRLKNDKITVLRIMHTSRKFTENPN